MALTWLSLRYSSSRDSLHSARDINVGSEMRFCRKHKNLRAAQQV